MLQKKYLYLITLITCLACNDDFLDTKPLGEISEESVWIDSGLAEAAVTHIYSGVGVGGLDEQMLSSLTDESLFTHGGRGIRAANQSDRRSDNTGWINHTYEWNNMYSYIRSANIAISKLKEGLLKDEDLSNRLLGESLFLRAYYYHQLVKFYGGVPLTSEPFSLDSDFNVPRNSFEECINFIVSDCDEAYTLLDGKSLESGRTNATTILALKSRILTYAASDLHDIAIASGKSSTIAGYSNKELLGYTSGNQEGRWRAAKDASKAVLDLANGYKFGLTSPESLEDAIKNYTNVYLSKNGGESDVIWNRQFTENYDGDSQRGHWWAGFVGRNNGPNGYHNWAGNTPLQNLIDAYAMEDGSEFDWDNATHKAAPYQNREARFYATILYDGADWKPRPDDVAEKDPANQIQTGEYQIMRDGSIITYFGLDSRNSSVEDWNGTRTGYYLKKFIDPDPGHVDQNTVQTIPWPFFRYTESVFNYVEALLEEGSEAEAKQWLNQIRYRAGMPATTETGDALMNRYREERRLELSFEEHRYHDARRWMIAPTTVGSPARIIEISGVLKPGANVTKYRYDPANYEYTYTPRQIDVGIENRKWEDESYFLPIRDNELKSNTSLIQNPGYE